MHLQHPGTPPENGVAPRGRALRRALTAARAYGLPVALGYAPVAAAYGLLARQSGLSMAEALFLSIWVFAGASQFLVVGMVAAGIGWPGWVLAGALINLRHLLFGVSMAPRWTGWPWGRKAAAGFGLTDEVYAVVATGRHTFDAFPEVVGLEATAYLSWLGGTLLGAWGSVVFPPALAEPLEFALPALFLALLVPALRERGAVVATLVGGGVSVAASAAGQGAWGMVLGGLLGALAGGLTAASPEIRKPAQPEGGQVRGE